MRRIVHNSPGSKAGARMRAGSCPIRWPVWIQKYTPLVEIISRASSPTTIVLVSSGLFESELGVNSSQDSVMTGGKMDPMRSRGSVGSIENTNLWICTSKMSNI